jgi:hypothetical protein
MIGGRRSMVATVPIGLIVTAGLLIGCSTTKEAAAPATAPATAAATQVVSSGGASGAASSSGSALKWPGNPARAPQVAVPILGGIPNSPPRATATPLPAGVTATAAPPPAAPGAPQKKQIMFYVDTVTSGPGESLVNVDPNVSCAQTSMFARGMHVVFRLMAYDNTGTELQTGNVDSLVLHINGKDVNFRYGRHGTGTPGEAWFWTATWDIPADQPLGVVEYSIDAKTKSGLAGTFKPLAISAPDKFEESRLQVVF